MTYSRLLQALILVILLVLASVAHAHGWRVVSADA
jgi:hypothetical protein